ncbi:MAG: hypothetical protein QGH15_20155 [Kiritimatiellia bacterium]|jgi:hypothetical protein|nr:hypothetical protein [Kiritimatiellia bacterium]
MTIWTTPAHYQLIDKEGGVFPWPARETPKRDTFVSGETTLTKQGKNLYMAHDNGSIRCGIVIHDDQVLKTREAHGDINRAIEEARSNM